MKTTGVKDPSAFGTSSEVGLFGADHEGVFLGVRNVFFVKR